MLNRENKKAKTVFAPTVARSLLKLGYRIIDIKPNKRAPKETLFIFKVEGNFNSDLYKLSEELKTVKTQEELAAMDAENNQ